MDHQNGRTVLHRTWFLAFATKFLGKIGFVSAAAGFKAQEKHSRLMLAHRSSKRHSVTAKHRAECALVLHRAPRTRSRILFQSLFAPGSALLAATRRCAGFSRRRRRINCACVESGPVFAVARYFAG